MVGLPDKAVAESRERVLGALGLALPPKRITVNLAPAAAGSPGGYSRFRITTLDRGGRAA